MLFRSTNRVRTRLEPSIALRTRLNSTKERSAERRKAVNQTHCAEARRRCFARCSASRRCTHSCPLPDRTSRRWHTQRRCTCLASPQHELLQRRQEQRQESAYLRRFRTWSRSSWRHSGTGPTAARTRRVPSNRRPRTGLRPRVRAGQRVSEQASKQQGTPRARTHQRAGFGRSRQCIRRCFARSQTTPQMRSQNETRRDTPDALLVDTGPVRALAVATRICNGQRTASRRRCKTRSNEPGGAEHIVALQTNIRC